MMTLRISEREKDMIKLLKNYYGYSRDTDLMRYLIATKFDEFERNVKYKGA